MKRIKAKVEGRRIYIFFFSSFYLGYIFVSPFHNPGSFRACLSS
jgi:hypothetical protein